MINKNQSQEILLKRKKAIELVKQQSLNWDTKLYSAYDFQLDMIIRDCCRYPSRKIGKAPYDYIKLS